MFKKISVIALSLLFVAQLAFANPDAVLGVWKNGEGTGMVQIFKKGDKYYGKIVWLKVPNNPDGTPRTDINNPDEKLRATPLKGLENLRGFKLLATVNGKMVISTTQKLGRIIAAK